MKIESVIYKCDIDECGEYCDDKIHKLIVVFTTEQTEGRSTNPYLYPVELNLCKKHLDEIIVNGKMIFANGAMGCNNYHFKS
jgi:hypothetical protein